MKTIILPLLLLVGIITNAQKNNIFNTTPIPHNTSGFIWGTSTEPNAVYRVRDTVYCPFLVVHSPKGIHILYLWEIEKDTTGKAIVGLPDSLGVINGDKEGRDSIIGKISVAIYPVTPTIDTTIKSHTITSPCSIYIYKPRQLIHY